MHWFSDPQAWIALITLTLLEIVLGIDNIVFISILAGKLPVNQQGKARQLGLFLAMFIRVGLLFSIAWLAKLTNPLFTVFGEEISGRDIIMIVGGLFLIAKSTHEIHDKLEGEDEHKERRVIPSFAGVLVQILLLDVVFSLDSVITAVGMAQQVSIMVAAVVIAVMIMLISSGPISTFVNRHPSVKMLALSFLILIGVALLGEGFEMHIPKGYIYFAMGFSIMVEMLNLRLRKVAQPVHLHSDYDEESGTK